MEVFLQLSRDLRDRGWLKLRPGRQGGENCLHAGEKPFFIGVRPRVGTPTRQE
jgi:hypothetical protein